MEFQVASWSYTFVLRCGWLCKLLPSFKVDPSFVIKAFWDPWTLQYCAFVCALPLWRGVDKLACHMSGYEQPDSRFLLHHEAPAHRRQLPSRRFCLKTGMHSWPNSSDFVHAAICYFQSWRFDERKQVRQYWCNERVPGATPKSQLQNSFHSSLHCSQCCIGDAEAYFIDTIV